MSIRLYGQWRLTVVEAVHNWPNRFVISEASTGGGIYPPAVGTTVNVNGAAWLLDAQHQPPGEAWQPSAMIFEPSVPEQVSVQATIGAEDPLPAEDYRDIRWHAVFQGGAMFDIPYRPYAVRTTDLFQMPDGVFEASFGTYYMGVRMTNRWGLPFSDAHVLDITPESRAALAAQGVVVLDDWTTAALASLGQRRSGGGMVVGPLTPGESRTLFFKVNVSKAPSRKHTVEFVCRNVNGVADPQHPARRVSKSIYVSRTAYDLSAGEMVFESRQGQLRVRLHEVAFDRQGYRRNRIRLRAAAGSAKGKAGLEKLRKALRALLEGKDIDLCEIQRLLACYCIEGEDGRPRPVFEPFYVVPTRFSGTFVPRFPFAGQYGPLLYDDPWWKLALAILALILTLLGALEESGQSAYEDEDFVIGTLFDSVRHQLDAALCLIDTSRDLSFLTVLDAQSDEANQTPVMALDGNVTGIQANVMSQEEVEALLLEAANSGDTSVLRVFKSGARTGLTFAEIAGFDPPWIRCDEDDVPLAQCPANRQTRFDDEDRPTLSFRPVATGSPAAPSEGLPAGIGVGRLACVAFGHFSPNTVFPSPHQFGGVAIADNRDVNLQTVGWPDNEPNSLYFAREGLTVTHAPSNRVVLRVGQYTGEHVTVQAVNAAGDLVDQVVKSTPNQAEVLQLAGEGIVRVTITGGGNEGILVQYCYDLEGQEPPARDWMRCFRGSMDLPQDAPIGRWIVYLAVQNINPVPGGVAPEIAATVIGGHVMGPSAQVLGCGFMLLGDHAFDIF